MFIDSNHAGNKQTRRSKTGLMIYMNMSLISWYLKQPSNIETSVFSTEFVAMKVGVETLRTIWYQLKMMGILISGASYVYGDNISVTMTPQTQSKHLRRSVMHLDYHAVYKSMAMGESLTGIQRQKTIQLIYKPIQSLNKRENILCHQCYKTYMMGIPNNG